MENRRIWEIDLFRAAAIFLMVVFHFVFDLNAFAGIKINYLSGFWYWEGKIAALIFIFLAGISSGFSHNNLRRGIKILAWAMVITLVTYVLFPEKYIRFGILHFLGVSMVLYPLLQRMPKWLLLAGAGVIALAAIPVKNTFADSFWLLPFGVRYRGFASLDYYPLIPYLAVFILGILTFKIYYHKKQSLFKFSCENKYIAVISRNSLWIYLIHQPVLVGLILAVRLLTDIL